MLTLEPESEAAISLEILSNKGIIPLTAFSNFIATQISSSKEQTIAQVHEHLGTSAKGMVEEVGGILNLKICFIQRFLQVSRTTCKNFLNLEYVRIFLNNKYLLKIISI